MPEKTQPPDKSGARSPVGTTRLTLKDKREKSLRDDFDVLINRATDFQYFGGFEEYNNQNDGGNLQEYIKEAHDKLIQRREDLVNHYTGALTALEERVEELEKLEKVQIKYEKYMGFLRFLANNLDELDSTDFVKMRDVLEAQDNGK